MGIESITICIHMYTITIYTHKMFLCQMSKSVSRWGSVQTGTGGVLTCVEALQHGAHRWDAHGRETHPRFIAWSASCCLGTHGAWGFPLWDVSTVCPLSLDCHWLKLGNLPLLPGCLLLLGKNLPNIEGIWHWHEVLG